LSNADLSIEEGLMAKGKDRGNREKKKPKAKKPASGPATSILSPRSLSAQSAPPKKQGQ
jgi:hypothetical protein